ncbi:MAG: hypothetical protein ACE5FG_06580 [Myxococcota bacterium]
MTAKRDRAEQEFEELLVEVLNVDHDLHVRRAGDPLGEGSGRAGTLRCRFRYLGNGDQAHVTVEVESVEGARQVMRVDLADPESIRRAAESCEPLALALVGQLTECPDALLLDTWEFGGEFGAG